MTNLLRSEWRKVMTTKLWWGMLLGSVALTALSVTGQIANATSGPMNAPPGYVAPNPLGDPATQRSIAASAVVAGIFALVVGIILLTTEFRHLTSRPTFLLQPLRGRIIGAKLIVAAAVGLMYAIVCAATVLAIMVPWLGARGVSIGWVSNGVLRTLGSSALAVAIYAVVGVGVGVLVRNQIAAVIGALGYFFVVEALIEVIPVIKDIYKYLPGAASDALVHAGPRGVSGSLLTQLQGGLVFLGWGLLFALGGWLVTMRRDIP
jgi:ABC-type transport system involved in multi-copper enzyme maturation permease subunit